MVVHFLPMESEGPHSDLKYQRLSNLFIILAGMFFLSQGVAMSTFFKSKTIEVVLFSPLEGKMTYHGKPAVGAKIKRTVAWKDQQGETDEFTVASDGSFSLPLKTTTYKDNPLAQLVITQTLSVLFEGKEYSIWTISKMESDLFTELGGKPINFICELTNEERTIRGNRSLGGTICNWDSLENKGDDNE